ncbi:MAG: hypothetical protein J7599_01080 [Niabella sp.]|nr:hypothetical protein [Niabella sp.]
MAKHNSLVLTMAAALFVLTVSCGNHSNDAQAVISKYCDLNTKEQEAPTGAAKQAAAAEKKAYEKEVDDRYFKDNKTYQLILEGMKKCDAAQAVAPVGSGEATDALLAMIPLATSDAVAAANAYCALVDQSITAAQNGAEAELKKIVAAKTIYEKNMDESFKDNTERRDSIFSLVKPCMEKEVAFRSR